MKSSTYFKKVILKFVISFVFLMTLLLVLPVVLADNNIRNTEYTVGEYEIYVYPSTCLDDSLIPIVLYEDESVLVAVLAYTCSSAAPKIKTFFGYIPIAFAYKIGLVNIEDFMESDSPYIYYHEKQIVQNVSNAVSIMIKDRLTDDNQDPNLISQWNLSGDNLQDFKDLFSEKEFMDMESFSRINDIKYEVYTYDSEGNEYVFFILDDGVVYEYSGIPNTGMSGSLKIIDSIDFNELEDILNNSE